MSFPQAEFDSWLDDVLEYEFKNALAWRTHGYREFIRNPADELGLDSEGEFADAKRVMMAKLLLVQDRVAPLVRGQKIGEQEFERIWRVETERVIREFWEDYQR
jgi:hypothetical protein